MPNGRTGGFSITRDDLAQILEGFPPETEVGWSLRVAASRPEKTTVTAKDARNLLARSWGTEASKRTEIGVEQQDYACYIMHVEKWVWVDKFSPLYDNFQRFHAQWLSFRSDRR